MSQQNFCEYRLQCIYCNKYAYPNGKPESEYYICDICEKINKLDSKYDEIIKYNIFKMINCTNCKIAIKKELYSEIDKFEIGYNFRLHKINLCYDCYKNRKDIMIITTEAKKNYFLNSMDLKNLRYNQYKSMDLKKLRYNQYKSKKWGYYKLYYIGDLIKKRNEKYNQDDIKKLIDNRENNIKKKLERKQNKEKISESRKQDIIKEGNIIGLKISDDDFDNEIVKEYLNNNKKCKYKLIDIMELLEENHFLEEKTDYILYIFTLYDEFSNGNRLVQYIFNCFRKIKKGIIEKNINIIYDIKISDKYKKYYDEKIYIEDNHYLPLFFKFIKKLSISLNIQKVFLKELIQKDKKHFNSISILSDYAKYFSVKNLANNKNIIISEKLLNIENPTNEYYLSLDNNIDDKIYEKYIEYVKLENPNFESNCMKYLNEYIDSIKNDDNSITENSDDNSSIIKNEPIEMKLVKKN
jgi:hypothetical protein